MVSFTRPPIRTISSSDENDAEGNKTESDGEEGSGEERMSCIDKQVISCSSIFRFRKIFKKSKF